MMVANARCREGMESCVIGIEFQDEKSCGSWMHSNVNVLNSTELYA